MRRKTRLRKRRQRLRLFEVLEERPMLVSDLQNPDNHFDVNADTYVSPIDALLVINKLTADAESSIDTTGFVGIPIAKLPGNLSQRVSLGITQSVSSAQLRGIGFFVMDNEAGDVSGASPTDDGYAQAVVSSQQHQRVDLSHPSALQSTTHMSFAGGSYVGAYISYRPR